MLSKLNVSNLKFELKSLDSYRVKQFNIMIL